MINGFLPFPIVNLKVNVMAQLEFTQYVVAVQRVRRTLLHVEYNDMKAIIKSKYNLKEKLIKRFMTDNN